MNNRHSFTWKSFLPLAALILLFVWFNLSLSAGHAQALSVNGQSAQPTATPADSTPQPADQAAASATPEQPSPHATGDCFACHSQPGMTGKLQNGETMSLFIDKDHYNDTIHSSCVFCHVDQAQYPHKSSPTESCAVCHWQTAGASGPAENPEFPLPFEDARAVSLSINNACSRCHSVKFDEIEQSVHTRTMAKGNRFSPVCVDCHAAHTINMIDRQAAAQLCSKCHLAEYIAYGSSVHGAALKAENNQDVPICDDCHGAHNVKGPRDADFRLDAFEMCGKCHADRERMQRYGISTDVLSTYLDDFHGRSADLFGQPGAAKVTKAACYDCHGVHNILPPDDPDSKVSTANLQRTCQECHPDANTNFPQAWLGHKTLSLNEVPGLFAINTVMAILVIATIAFFIVYILLDVRRRFAVRISRVSPSKTEQGK